MTTPSLIIFSGLPGTGKTTIARELARRIHAVYIRIDSIEQAIRDSAIGVPAVEDAGYRAGYALAADNLASGHSVVADSVNPLPITRDAWRAVGERARVRVVEIEVVCSDREEHRRRVETRAADVVGLKAVTWQEVIDRDYRAWDRERIIVDTAHVSIEESAGHLLCRFSSLPSR